MIVAKLSNGRIVQYLKPPQPVQFASGLHVLVCQMYRAPGSADPYWMPATSVVWIMDF